MSSLTDQLKPLGGYVRVLVDDDEVQASVRRAGASLGKAAKRMLREQERPHRARKVLVGVLVLAGLGGLLAGASKWLQGTPSVGAP